MDPTATAMSSTGKRPAATAADIELAKRARPTPKSLVGCRVALTGFFGLPRAQVEKRIESYGAHVDHTLNDMTSHLVLGKSGYNRYGHTTGHGSTKHNEAVRRCIPIIDEETMNFILDGEHAQLEVKRRAPSASATLANKILFCMHSARAMGWDYVSIGLLGYKLWEAYKVDFLVGKRRQALDACLKAYLLRGQLTKRGTVYKLAYSQLPIVAPASQPSSAIDDGSSGTKTPAIAVNNPEHTTTEQKPSPISTPKSSISSLMSSPVAAQATATARFWLRVDTTQRPNWRGLRKIGEKLSPSGRAKCKGCDKKIATGVLQLQLEDDSLYQIAVANGAPKSRNSLIEEVGIPGIKYIAIHRFFVHSECIEKAELLCRKKFMSDWNAICDFNDEFVAL